MRDLTANLQISLGSQRYRADLARRRDLSIKLNFDAAQPNCFAAPQAHAAPLSIAGFTGSVASGASCNCSTYTLTPHCNGTHTECVGHITRDAVNVCDVAVDGLLLARLISLHPTKARDIEEQLPHCASDDDLVITRAALQQAVPVTSNEQSALILRTLPNTQDKLETRYSNAASTAYFTVDAAQWLVDAGVMHLIVDLPSIDRMQDGGKLLAHRRFWGMPLDSVSASTASRPRATITELAFIPEEVADGLYLLTLQIAPFAADAAPSRPIIYPLSPL